MFTLSPKGQIITVVAVVAAEVALCVLYKKFLNNIEKKL